MFQIMRLSLGLLVIAFSMTVQAWGVITYREMKNMKLEELHKISTEKRLEITKLAAEQGDVEAQFDFGFFYSTDTEAAKWYCKAAERGHNNAQHNLGVLYDRGRGVPQSDDEAAKWYHKAVRNGRFPSLQFIGHDIVEVPPPKNDYLGMKAMYLSSRGDFAERVSAAEAIKRFHKVAEHGNADAQYLLGLAYALSENYVEAASWYRKAAEHGDMDAQSALGVMHSKGQGVTNNDTEAEKWRLKAASRRYEDAKKALKDLGK